MGECEKEVIWLKSTLQQKFKLVDLEDVSRYLGVHYVNIPNGIFIH
jgi:hypothetical protein